MLDSQVQRQRRILSARSMWQSGMDTHAIAKQLGISEHVVLDYVAVDTRKNPPCEALIERDERYRRPDLRDLTGRFFGDPEPWRSALAQKQGRSA